MRLSFVAILHVCGVLTLACCIANGQQMCRTTVLVTAVSQKTDQPVDGLVRQDFHAKLKGRAISIESIASAPRHRRIVFVVDRSGSMEGVSQLRPVGHYDPETLQKMALENLLSAIPSDDSVAFLAFAGKESTRTEFMGPAAARQKAPAILAWQPERDRRNRQTALWDNLESALGILTPHEIGDVILVLSDGGDNMSRLNERKLRGEFLSSGVQAFAMVIANPIVATSQQRNGLFSLIDLAGSTGGAARVMGPNLYGIDEYVLLPVQPDQFIKLLAHQYAMEVESLCGDKAEKWHLEVGRNGSDASALLFYPRSLLMRTVMP